MPALQGWWAAGASACSPRALNPALLSIPAYFLFAVRTLPPAGELPFDHELVRQAAGLIKRLPAVDSQQFGADYTTVSTVLCGTVLYGTVLCCAVLC